MQKWRVTFVSIVSYEYWIMKVLCDMLELILSSVLDELINMDVIMTSGCGWKGNIVNLREFPLEESRTVDVQRRPQIKTLRAITHGKIWNSISGGSLMVTLGRSIGGTLEHN